MRTARLVVLASWLIGTASGHRLDEYLQSAVFELDGGNVRVQLRLTPGVAVLPAVLAMIDADHDGAVSGDEESAYARRVVREAELAIDGKRRDLELVSVRFPTISQFQQGLGEIEIDCTAPGMGGARSGQDISFRNFHQREISAYLMNFLTPEDRSWRIEKQFRNEEQSEYRVRLSRKGSGPAAPVWLGAAGMVLLTVRFLWRAG